MSDPANISDTSSIPMLVLPPQQTGPNLSSDQANILLGIADNVATRLNDHSMKLANHDGQLSGVASSIAATQSSLSSWATVATGIGALVVAVVTFVGAFQVFQFQKTDTLSDSLRDTSNKVEAISGKVEALSAQNVGISGKVDDVSKSIGVLSSIIQTLSRRVETLGANQARPPQGTRPNTGSAPR